MISQSHSAGLGNQAGDSVLSSPYRGVLGWVSPTPGLPPAAAHPGAAAHSSHTALGDCIAPQSGTALGQPAWRHRPWATSTHAPLSATASVIQPFLPSLLLLPLPSQSWLSMADHRVGLLLLPSAPCSGSWSAAGRQSHGACGGGNSRISSCPAALDESGKISSEIRPLCSSWRRDHGGR